LLTKATNTRVEKIVEKEVYFNNLSIDKVYDLAHYDSTATPSESLDKRLDRLYVNYLKVKDNPKSTFYNKEQELDPDWERTCVNNLRKIHGIASKLEVIENSISILCDGKEESTKYFELLVENKQYHDRLEEMSNFYAKFISNYMYDKIIKSID
jgi:hypothetical protein